MHRSGCSGSDEESRAERHSLRKAPSDRTLGPAESADIGGPKICSNHSLSARFKSTSQRLPPDCTESGAEPEQHLPPPLSLPTRFPVRPGHHSYTVRASTYEERPFSISETAQRYQALCGAQYSVVRQSYPYSMSRIGSSWGFPAIPFMMPPVIRPTYREWG